MDIKWVGSPNFDTSRKAIKQIVIHWFGLGKLAGVDATFQKPSGTSAHYAIEDTTIHQYVKEEHVAYAVGVYSRNQETISIEHSAEPGRDASNATYSTSSKLVAEISKRHNIPLDREHIIGHNQIKATQCPGTMDIDRIIREAKAYLTPVIVEPVITSQTKIHAELLKSEYFKPESDLEVQAIKSVINDKTRDYRGAMSQAEDLARQLLECQIELKKAQDVVVIPCEATITNPFAKLLHDIALAIDGRGRNHDETRS